MKQLEKPPKDVQWHDLTPVSRRQTLGEILLPLPWLGLSWGLYSSDFWYLGPVASFVFFLCALRLNHEAIHGNLGLGRPGDSIVMHGLSALMLGANHAVAYNHLQHHRFAMGPGDHEGKCGHMTFWQVLIYGPRFPVDLNLVTWRSGSRRWRRLMLLDWLGIVTFAGVVVWLSVDFLMLHLGAMIVAQCLTALFAVWITHQGTETSGLAGRSQRGVLARLAYLMFYHREHHLFPNVPVSRLPVLAERLDTKVPGYAQSRMPVVALMESLSQKPQRKPFRA
ncbi:MAG: fatty acid desaturase [Rhodobacteraceae bacterium]|nr:fatty acid desaturase [Paracoccaceae bacterium]